jgi:nicotinamide-nucleotide amidase
MSDKGRDNRVAASSTLAAALVAELAAGLGQLLLARGWTVTTAESCTGGLIAAALTDIDGCSAWFRQGVVTYANHSKSALLGVDAKVIETQGAVSETVVQAMADGARMCAGAEVAVAVSGIAGPSGGSTDKPVGTVWIAWCVPGAAIQAERYLFDGDRQAVREAALLQALRGTILRINSVN